MNHLVLVRKSIHGQSVLHIHELVCQLSAGTPSFQDFGPSGVRAPAVSTQVATILGNWSERVACASGAT